MTDYAAVGNAIKTTLLADAWLGNPANVKSIETEKRGYDIQAQKDAMYFSKDDLPAIAIVATAQGKASEQTTTNEIVSVIKPQVVGLVRQRDRQAAISAACAIAANIERVLEKQKSSAQALGIDAFVNNVSTGFEDFKDGEYYLIVATTVCDVEITTSF